MSYQLLTTDEHIIKIDKLVAKKMDIFEDMHNLDDSVNIEENIIPVSVESDLLTKIIEFCDHYKAEPVPDIDTSTRGVEYFKPIDEVILTNWDQEFFGNDTKFIGALANASVFLQCQHLMYKSAAKLRELMTYDPMPSREELERWVAPVANGGMTLQQLRDAGKKAGIMYGYDEGLDEDDRIREGWRSLFLNQMEWDSKKRERESLAGRFWTRRAKKTPSEIRRIFNQESPPPVDPRFYVPSAEEFEEWFEPTNKGGLTLDRLRWYARKTGVEPPKDLSREDFKAFFQERSMALYGRPIPNEDENDDDDEEDEEEDEEMEL